MGNINTFNIKAISSEAGISYMKLYNAFRYDSFEHLEEDEINDLLEVIEHSIETIKQKIYDNGK